MRIKKEARTRVISAFPACGKTTYFLNKQKVFQGILDSDSSEFSWVKDEKGNNTKERNPDFPNNYIQHIKANIGKVDIIFVSSHAEVRKALKQNKIKYALVYPDISLKDEWLKRFKRRRNTSEFIEFMDKNWDKFITEIEKEIYPEKIKLPYGTQKYINTLMIMDINSLN